MYLSRLSKSGTDVSIGSENGLLARRRQGNDGHLNSAVIIMSQTISGTQLLPSGEPLLSSPGIVASDFQQPAWMRPYTDGTRNGYAQSLLAYAEYFSIDGSADTDPEIEERMAINRTPMIAYASRTGTKRNLDAMRQNGWRLLVSAKGVLRTEGFKYCLDNGAWSAFTSGQPFDDYAFQKAFELLGESADFVVVPDIVCGGRESLDFSLKWLERLKGSPAKLLLATQNGITPDDVREYLSPAVGLFVGGDTEWKLKTVHSWGILARRRNCHLHVGRVNSAKRIDLCARAGAHSVDGTSASMYSKVVPALSAAVDNTERQADFCNPNGQAFDLTPYDCAWPLDLQ